MISMKIDQIMSIPSNILHLKDYQKKTDCHTFEKSEILLMQTFSKCQPVIEFCLLVLVSTATIRIYSTENCLRSSAPFEHRNGLDVWRHLVKVCSGLDSFIIGELQVMSQFRDQ